MKTLFANNETQNFDNFSFDVLTVEELACIKGGKEDDAYIEIIP
ncbi:MAG TPA: bacteriocin [Prolixibacteraceae bacterium]|nr:bacteriocin [Prolixibacteraceae bacterium]